MLMVSVVLVLEGGGGVDGVVVCIVVVGGGVVGVDGAGGGGRGKVVGTNERPNHGPWPAALHWPALHLSEHTPANTPNTLSTPANTPNTHNHIPLPPSKQGYNGATVVTLQKMQMQKIGKQFGNMEINQEKYHSMTFNKYD